MVNVKFVTGVALFCSVFLFADLSSRFMTGNDVGTGESVLKNGPIGQIRFLGEQQKSELVEILKNYDVKKKPKKVVKAPVKKQENKAKIMSLEEQNSQHGELLDLFVGNNKYKLLGTFDDNGDRFAHLIESDLVTGKVSDLRLDTGKELSGGYFVTQVDGNSVQLEKDDRVISLQLFIYK